MDYRDLRSPSTILNHLVLVFFLIILEICGFGLGLSSSQSVRWFPLPTLELMWECVLGGVTISYPEQLATLDFTRFYWWSCYNQSFESTIKIINKASKGTGFEFGGVIDGWGKFTSYLEIVVHIYLHHTSNNENWNW